MNSAEWIIVLIMWFAIIALDLMILDLQRKTLRILDDDDD